MWRGRRSADRLQRLVAKHGATARVRCPSLKAKNVKPHTLRHAADMALLRRGVDLSVIALWFGHESTETTQIYLHADMQLKERALAHATLSGLKPERFRPPDPQPPRPPRPSDRLPGEPVIMPTQEPAIIADCP